MKTERYKMKDARGILRLRFLFIACLLLGVFGCKDRLEINTYRDTGTSLDGLVPEAMRVVQEGLGDENPYIRANAIEVVVAAKQIKLMPGVRRLLQDRFTPVRFSAALAVGDLRYSFAESSVRQLLKDRDENVRIAAAYALVKLGQAESFAILRSAITSEDQTVRANAALLLGKSGDERAAGLLYEALNDDNSDYRVRFQAVEAIARLGDKRIYPKVWAMLISAYADDRVLGISAMSALGTEQARNALITMLDDDVLEVRLAAAEQLGKLKDTTGEPEVLDVFTKDLTSDLDKEGVERVNMRTALAIGQIGTASLTRYLPQFLKDKSKLVRIAAAMAVFQCVQG